MIRVVLLELKEHPAEKVWDPGWLTCAVLESIAVLCPLHIGRTWKEQTRSKNFAADIEPAGFEGFTSARLVE